MRSRRIACPKCNRIRPFHAIGVSFERKADSPLHCAQIKMARLFARNGYPRAQELLQNCSQAGPKKTKRFAEIVRPSGRSWAWQPGVSHTWFQKLVRQFQAYPNEMYREARRCGEPAYLQLTRPREYTRRIREEGELRGSRLAKVADFLSVVPIEGRPKAQSAARHLGARASSENSIKFGHLSTI